MPNKVVDTRLFLTMQVLKEELEEKYEILSWQIFNDDPVLDGVSLYYGQKNLKENKVYLASAAALAEHPPVSSEMKLICVGSPETLPAGMSSIVVGNAPWEEVFAFVQELIAYYTSWEQKLLNILSNGGGLYELNVSALEYLKNPVTISDNNHNILSVSQWVIGTTEMRVSNTTGEAEIPERVAAQLRSSATIEQRETTHGAHLYENWKWLRSRAMYANVWAGEKRCGRVRVQELYTIFSARDFLLLSYFARFLELAYEQNLFVKQETTGFEVFLQGVYFGENNSEEDLKLRCHMAGWEKGERFECAVVELQDKTINVAAMKAIRSHIAVSTAKSFSFWHEDRLYVLVSLSGVTNTERLWEEIFSRLNSVVPVRICRSMEFVNMSYLREAYRQADKILGISAYDPACPVVRFSDVVLEFILGHFRSEFSIEGVISPAIRLLDHIDREKETEYIPTLEAFFNNNCQRPATAQALFIHRSTLDYRLKKIEELTRLNLEDADTRLYLQISLRLLPQVEREDEL